MNRFFVAFLGLVMGLRSCRAACMFTRILSTSVVFLVLVAGVALPAYSNVSYSLCSLSLVTPIQTVSADSDIQGLRLNLLYGENREVHGLDLGVVNVTTRTLTGVQVGGLNWDHGQMSGIQIGVDNVFQGTSKPGNATDAWGDEGDGVQLGALNIVTDARLNGIQVGIINVADAMSGLQVGIMNVATQLRGVQIGLLNFIPSSPCVFMPIINALF